MALSLVCLICSQEITDLSPAGCAFKEVFVAVGPITNVTPSAVHLFHQHINGVLQPALPPTP